MENLNWLEWDTVTTPLSIDVIQNGNFPKQITTIDIIREENLNLVAVGRGMGSFLLEVNKKLRAGEWASFADDTVGRTKCGALVKLKGVVLINSENKISPIENAYPLTIRAMVSEVEFIRCGLPIVSQIEWIVNFSTDNHVPLGRTDRRRSSFLKIERSGCSSIEFGLNESLDSSFDHFRCECTIDNQRWSLIIGNVVDKVAPASYKPGFIEFEKLNNRCLPCEDVKQAILTSLSFALGRQLVSVGSTSLGQGGDCIGFIARGIHLLDKKAYSQPSKPPVPLGISLQEIFLDDEKISKIISCVATKMKTINIENSFFLIHLGLASPLDVQAAHLGAAIESLRKEYCGGNNKLSTVLVSDNIWRETIKKPLIEAFNNIVKSMDEDNIDINALNILKKNLEQLNNKSSNQRYQEFFSLLSLQCGKIEEEALKERNKPAHGYCYESSRYPELSMIINALYSLFNRLILKITEASDCYIDYSTYGYPVRNIDHPLGGTEGDGNPISLKKK